MTTRCSPIPVALTANDLDWLSLSCDAGSSTHEPDVTLMGVTPKDLGLPDPDGTDLGWLSLETPPLHRFKA